MEQALPSMKLSTVWERNCTAFTNRKRCVINQGGTSSGKTWSILQLLIIVAAYARDRLLISVVSESLPHLKRGCIRDFRAIMGGAFDNARWNRTDTIYSFDRATLEFFPADQHPGMRGGRRDILFINECNNVTREAFDELDVRTRRCTILDYNPVAEFWAMELPRLPGQRISTARIVTRRSMCRRRSWSGSSCGAAATRTGGAVYGMGKVGAAEGLVHPVFHAVDAMPEGGNVIYGLDFGYANDPTALVRCVVKGDELYCDELLYEAGLTNRQIALRLEALGARKGYDGIVADAAEPKSIDEIKLYGWNIRPAVKGPDSVRQGIDRVNQYRQF